MTLPRSTALGWTPKTGGLILRDITRGAWTGRLCAWGGTVAPALSLAGLWAETWGKVMPGDLPKLEEARWWKNHKRVVFVPFFFFNCLSAAFFFFFFTF